MIGAEMMLPVEVEARDRRRRILDGARSAFLRFGFERTSLADIAAEAGVSRTAVYHYFPGKEEVLRAVVEELHAHGLHLAKVAAESSATLDTALSELLQARFGRLLVAISASPHAADLADASHRLTGPIARAADDAFQDLVVAVLSRHRPGSDASAVADTLIAAAKGLMRSGHDYVGKDRFDARLGQLIRWANA